MVREEIGRSFGVGSALRRSPLALLVAALLLAAGATSAQALPLHERTVISSGHTDLIDALYENGDLYAEVHDDSVEPSLSRPIQAVLAHVKPEAEIEVPPLAEYEFIGPAGSSAWLLPQTQQIDLLWPGWRTTSLPDDTFDGALRWRLLGVDGPGRVTLFSNGAFGEPSVIFNSANGFPARASMPLNSHVHANWTFGAEGVYRVIFALEGTLTVGGTVSSAPLEYRFYVGDLADLPADSTTELSISGAKSNYQSGEEVLLSTAQSPDTGFSDYRWSKRCGEDAEWAAAGEGAALWFDARASDDGCEVRVALHDEDGELVDVSDPVTIAVGKLVLSVGHTDAVAPFFEDGKLGMRVKDDTETTGEGSVFRNPSEVIFHARPEAEWTVSEELHELGYGFLGPVGSPSWVLPEVQEPELLWPGFSSEEIGAGELEGDALDWHLERVEGPGTVNLWNEGTFEAIRVFRAEEPLPQTKEMNVGTHAHFAWAFGAEGMYALYFEAEAHRGSDGARVRTGPQIYHFYVGDLAAMPELPFVELAVAGLVPSGYVAGEGVTLSVSSSPADPSLEYVWSRRCGEQLGLSEIGTGPELSFVSTLADDGCEYFVSAEGGGGLPLAISAPARISVRAPQQPPAGVPPAGGGDEAKPVTKLNLRGARVQGRWLFVDLRLSAAARARAFVKQGGETIVASRMRRVAAGERRVAFKLRRKLAPGRYKVAVKLRGLAKPRTAGLRIG